MHFWTSRCGTRVPHCGITGTGADGASVILPITHAIPEYDHLDGLALGELVRRGEIAPRELVSAALERLARRNPAINAVISERAEQALAEAELADGPFRAVPFLVKDLLSDLGGEVTASGSRLLRGFRAPVESEIVARWRRSGLVVVGRTNTPEMGLLGHTAPLLYGPCRNPWHLDHTPGGSSGGSAAAVAARIVPIAGGGDGGGSIRIPAANCGLFGLKPTRGRTPLGPRRGEDWNGLVVQHVVSRSVRDSAAVLDATAGGMPGDPYAAPPADGFLAGLASPPPRLRVALHTGSLFGKAIDPECVAAVEDAGRLLSGLGHDVEPAVPEFDRDALVAAYFVIVCANTSHMVRAASRAAGRPAGPRELETVTWFLRQIGERLPAADLLGAIETMHRESRRVAAFFARYDVLVTATLATPPQRIGAQDPKPSERLAMKLVSTLPLRPLLRKALADIGPQAMEPTPNTQLFNMTGQPAMSVPLAWSRDGLPIGIQIAGRFGEEGLLLRLAAELEAARPWAGRLPPLVAGETA